MVNRFLNFSFLSLVNKWEDFQWPPNDWLRHQGNQVILRVKHIPPSKQKPLLAVFTSKIALYSTSCATNELPPRYDLEQYHLLGCSEIDRKTCSKTWIKPEIRQKSSKPIKNWHIYKRNYAWIIYAWIVSTTLLIVLIRTIRSCCRCIHFRKGKSHCTSLLSTRKAIWLNWELFSCQFYFP